MYHVNPATGDVGQCRAVKDKCPYGGLETHFTTANAARAAYEKQQNGGFSAVKTYEEKFPYKLVSPAGSSRIVLDERNKFADGAYPKLFGKYNSADGMVLYGPYKELVAYLEANGVANPKEELKVNENYSREQKPLIDPTAPKVSKTRTPRQPKPFVFPIPKTHGDFTTAILSTVPKPEDSKVLKQPVTVDHEGYLGGARYIGGSAIRLKDDGTKAYIGQTEAAAELRKLVTAAKAAGELPKWVDISVRKNDGAWVTSINVEIGYLPDGGRKAKSIPRDWREVPAEDSWARAKATEAGKRLEDYVTLLGKQFENSDINGMVDYHSSSNAGRIRWRDSYRD